MPWLVSILMIGSVMGAFVMVATRRSVIFNSEGLELVLTFCGTASSVSSAQNAAPRRPAAPFKKPRRLAAEDWAGTPSVFRKLLFGFGMRIPSRLDAKRRLYSNKNLARSAAG